MHDSRNIFSYLLIACPLFLHPSPLGLSNGCLRQQIVNGPGNLPPPPHTFAPYMDSKWKGCCHLNLSSSSFILLSQCQPFLLPFFTKSCTIKHFLCFLLVWETCSFLLSLTFIHGNESVAFHYNVWNLLFWSVFEKERDALGISKGFTHYFMAETNYLAGFIHSQLYFIMLMSQYKSNVCCHAG